MTLKLLNTVLNTNAIWIDIVDNEVRYGTDDYRHSYFKMNIYKFANLCKEWATSSKHKHSISSYPLWNITLYKGKLCWIAKHNRLGVQWEADSESDAIIKATQWIIDNHNTKG